MSLARKVIPDEPRLGAGQERRTALTPVLITATFSLGHRPAGNPDLWEKITQIGICEPIAEFGAKQQLNPTGVPSTEPLEQY